MSFFSFVIPEWSSTTWLALVICLISALRLVYWQLYKKDHEIALEKAKRGIPSAEDNSGIPRGPKGLPFVGTLSALGPEPHRVLADLGQIYGDVLQVQLGSFPTLVVSSMSLAREALVKQAAQFSPTGEPVRIVQVALGWNSPHSKRGALRSLAPTQALSKALKAAHASGVVRDAIKHAVEGLGAAVKEEVGDTGEGNTAKGSQITGLRSILRRATLSVLLEIGFGVQLGCEGSPKQLGEDSREVRGNLALLEVILSEIWQLVNTAVLADHIPILRAATGTLTTRCRFLARQRDRIVRDLVAGAKKAQETVAGKGQEGSKGGESLVQTLLTGQEESRLSDGEVVSLLADFVQRGVLPVGATVEWGIAELTRHPEIQTRLHQELEVEAFGREGDVPRQALARTPLLAAVLLLLPEAAVQETLRLHPTQSLSSPRKALAAMDVGGYAVFKGQNVVINAWGLGRDARLFRSPSDFLPQRFSSDALHSLLEAKDLYWNSFPVDETEVLIDLAAHLLGHLVRNFEWVPGIKNDTRSLQEGPGIEVSELSSALTASAKVR